MTSRSTSTKNYVLVLKSTDHKNGSRMQKTDKTTEFNFKI